MSAQVPSFADALRSSWPTDLSSIFISHSSADSAFGERLTAVLRTMGYDTWYDRAPGRAAGGFIGGDAWWERIWF